MTKSLVQLSTEVATLERALLENNGVLPPELEEQFDLTTGSLREKVDRYKYVIDVLESRGDYFKARELELKHAKQIFENQADRLRQNLRYVMTQSGESDLIGNDWRFKLTAPKEKLVTGKVVPDEYMKEVVVKEVDKDAILTALKMGFEVEGCSIEQARSLRVYVNPGSHARLVKESEE